MGLPSLPFRTRPDSCRKDPPTERNSVLKLQSILKPEAPRKNRPEILHLTPVPCRIRSPTESSISSILSAHIPDSATTRSASSLASPISTSYGDCSDHFSSHSSDGSRPSSRFRHRHHPSIGSCSTFVNDEDESLQPAAYSNLRPKLDAFYSFQTKITEIDEPESPRSVSFTAAEVKAEPLESPAEGNFREGPTPVTSPKPRADEWETASNSSDDCSPQDADTILNHTLQLVYGVDLQETSIQSSVSAKLVQKFLKDVSQHVWQCPTDNSPGNGMSSSSLSSTPSQGISSSDSQRAGKRKKQGKSEEDGDEFSDGEGPVSLPKRARPNPRDDDNLRLSCPFRKRNPHRFNVRDHHSCAMTYFPKFAELRQHIVKQHKRDDPSAFVCDRCNRDFHTRKELRDHQRLPKEQMCDISDHDPESGIDGPTANKLLSRKRASGTSAEVQWREIWNIVFPDDEDAVIQPYYFTPVIEHFELSSHYLTAFDSLHASLRSLISNPATLETLATKFEQCFIETVERCVAEAQSRPYMNRSNKRNEPARPPVPQSLMLRKAGDSRPRPDSGVIMDDGSEESGSVAGSQLEHKPSVRTIGKGSNRHSNLSSGSQREVLPAPPPTGLYEHSLMQHFATQAPFGMDVSVTDPAAAVEAWDNGIMHTLPNNLALDDYLISAQNMPAYPDIQSWDASAAPTTDFGNGMGGGFVGFNGQPQ
ncbi:hypothetical protein HJFPF1_08683 [Paramyrothecium foliicola]|nr:hypothetical protein HJFPF1_08683 [Paramyrothecium foliicola]